MSRSLFAMFAFASVVACSSASSSGSVDAGSDAGPACSTTDDCANLGCVCTSDGKESVVNHRSCIDGVCGTPSSGCPRACDLGGAGEWTGRTTADGAKDGGSATVDAGGDAAATTPCTPPAFAASGTVCAARSADGSHACVAYLTASNAVLCTYACSFGCPSGFACKDTYCQPE
ncbi:MAG: hypothetical protein U0169_24430 [Polyangiaceae bacterium]